MADTELGVAVGHPSDQHVQRMVIRCHLELDETNHGTQKKKKLNKEASWHDK